MDTLTSKKVKLKTKRTFLKLGTCSRTFFFILNREFGHPMTDEEQAIDLLAGGIVQHGYQCGMLWGASMALGAESYRRCENQGQAISMSILSTQHIMESFRARTNTIDCEDITKTDFNNKLSMTKYMITGKFWSCFKLAEKWAPEVIDAAHEALSIAQASLAEDTMSCASEVIRKMGGTDEEIHMVAGLAGGIGLSGDGCGALGAAIWMNTLRRIRNNDYKAGFSDAAAVSVIQGFHEETDYKMECSEICGQKFNNMEAHTEYVKNGGCSKLIEVLAKL